MGFDGYSDLGSSTISGLGRLSELVFCFGFSSGFSTMISGIFLFLKNAAGIMNPLVFFFSPKFH